MHELVNSSRGEPLETYQYEELSGKAQRAVDGTVENGNYEITDESQVPDEFRYWDEAATYDVTSQNETYRILTYSSMGCEDMYHPTESEDRQPLGNANR